MISVWLPLLPLERLKRDRSVPDDRPFALVGQAERGLLLTAINARSESEGLFTGQALADARAICPRLLTAPADPAQDARALLALARWAGRYSPHRNGDGLDGLRLEITGIPHLFGGEAALLADLATRLAGLGFTARLALAPTLGAAHALARFARAPRTIVPPGKMRAALAALPIEALRLAPPIVSLLKRLGLKRIGQLYDLPRASLQHRFPAKDAAEAVLLRLDQALGTKEEPSRPLLPAPCHVAQAAFPEPLITAEGVAASLDRLAATLCATLMRKQAGAKRVRLAIHRSDGSVIEIEAGFSAPARDPQHLLLLLQDKVANLDVGFGIELMRLEAHVVEPLPLAQTTLVEPQRKESAATLVDRLANRLRPQAVQRLLLAQSHVPERAQTSRSAIACASSWGVLPTKPPRPPLLLSDPEPLDVVAEIPEGPPARFIWRRVTRRVVKAEGPERIAPEWWRETQARPRDYYRIEDDDGRRYWVFREGLYRESAGDLPRWYLHGVFG
jgi:protein ImuB